MNKTERPPEWITHFSAEELHPKWLARMKDHGMKPAKLNQAERIAAHRAARTPQETEGGTP